jgi:TolA-binding protein
MNIARFVLCAFCVLMLGCSDSSKAKDLFETAAFEENQNNVAHAKELYQELVNLYPSTREAELAKTRLTDLSNRQ